MAAGRPQRRGLLTGLLRAVVRMVIGAADTGAAIVRSSTRGLQEVYLEALEEYRAEQAAHSGGIPGRAPGDTNAPVIMPGAVVEEVVIIETSIPVEPVSAVEIIIPQGANISSGPTKRSPSRSDTTGGAPAEEARPRSRASRPRKTTGVGTTEEASSAARTGLRPRPTSTETPSAAAPGSETASTSRRSTRSSRAAETPEGEQSQRSSGKAGRSGTGSSTPRRKSPGASAGESTSDFTHDQLVPTIDSAPGQAAPAGDLVSDLPAHPLDLTSDQVEPSVDTTPLLDSIILPGSASELDAGPTVIETPSVLESSAGSEPFTIIETPYAFEPVDISGSESGAGEAGASDNAGVTQGTSESESMDIEAVPT